MTTTHPRRVYTTVALLAFLLTAMITRAAVPVEFDIPAQPAPAALKIFTKQSGAQVVYLHDDLEAVVARSVNGQLMPAEALARLFADSGLSIEPTGNGNFVLSRPVAKTGTVEGYVREAGSGRPVAGASVMVAGSGQSVQTDRKGRFTLSDVPAGEHELRVTAEGMQSTRVVDVAIRGGHRHTLSPIGIPQQREGVTQLEDFVVSAKKNDGVIELDPYSVEGRKDKPFVANMDIPRTINDAQPYYIFDAKTIDASGARNLEDFLKQRLTMNTVAVTNGQFAGNNARGTTSSINLRGVGTDKTLVLVDGRRLPGVTINQSASATALQQGDVNGIPIGAIERVEVLPSSASGIYGGGAIGGVVNIILKKDFRGGELRATYDNTWKGGAPRRSVSISHGMVLEGGKTTVMASASWADQKSLRLKDRVEIFRRNMNDILSRDPSFIYSSGSPWLGRLPNIVPNAAGETTLVLKPAFGGAVLNSRNTHVPAGTSPDTIPAQLGAGLLVNSGRWNMEFPSTYQDPSGLLRPLASEPETKAFQLNIRRQMLPWLELTGGIFSNENRSSSTYYPIVSVLTVPANAPTNPFTTAVRVRVPDAGEAPTSATSDIRALSLGAVASLPGNWTAVLDFSKSASRFSSLYSLQDTSAISADLASGMLNPFVDTLEFPREFDRYWRPLHYLSKSRLTEIALKGFGELPALPWGKPNLAVGLERRSAESPESVQRQDYPLTPVRSVDITYYARKSVTDVGYTEMAVPLIKSAWLPGIQALDLQLSGRVENYEVDSGTSSRLEFYGRTPPATSYNGPVLNGQPYFAKADYQSSNYTTGLKYQPVTGVTIRLSQATAFLPPTPDQLIRNPQPNPSLMSINDPVTGQSGVLVSVFSGGNPDLRPQNSKSRNAGIIWEPLWKPLEGLRLNVEYYKIEQFDAITSLGAQGIVNQESLFPGRVVRDGSNVITQVDASMVNLYHRETEGWDLSASYAKTTEWGRFSFFGVGSIIRHNKEQYSQTQPEFDTAGYHPSEGGVPTVKANYSVNWERGGWTAGWTVRHQSSYKQYGAAGGPLSVRNANGAVYSMTYITAQGSDTVPSQEYHDVFVGYAFDKPGEKGSATRPVSAAKLLDGVSVQVGVRNVFDKVPPLDVIYTSYFLSPYGDVSLRSFWVTVRKRF